MYQIITNYQLLSNFCRMRRLLLRRFLWVLTHDFRTPLFCWCFRKTWVGWISWWSWLYGGHAGWHALQWKHRDSSGLRFNPYCPQSSVEFSKFLLPPFLTKVAQNVENHYYDPNTGSDFNPTVQISVLGWNIYQAEILLISIFNLAVLACWLWRGWSTHVWQPVLLKCWSFEAVPPVPIF